MSEEDQAALKECATESITYMFDLCDELRADYVAKAEAQGVIFSEADVAAFQAACADVIADVAGRNDLTQSVYDAILSLR
jgi:TRAP-type C4-dicarboxylate transport system substrate-binding protein